MLVRTFTASQTSLIVWLVNGFYWTNPGCMLLTVMFKLAQIHVFIKAIHVLIMHAYGTFNTLAPGHFYFTTADPCIALIYGLAMKLE